MSDFVETQMFSKISNGYDFFVFEDTGLQLGILSHNYVYFFEKKLGLLNFGLFCHKT